LEIFHTAGVGARRARIRFRFEGASLARAACSQKGETFS
jgi:hypothetical protein